MGETERGMIRLENGRFPGDHARPADRPPKPPKNSCRSRRQSGGTHFVQEFLRVARVQNRCHPASPLTARWQHSGWLLQPWIRSMGNALASARRFSAPGLRQILAQHDNDYRSRRIKRFQRSNAFFCCLPAVFVSFRNFTVSIRRNSDVSRRFVVVLRGSAVTSAVRRHAFRP